MKNLLHASAAEVREQATGQHVLVSPHHVTVAAAAEPAGITAVAGYPTGRHHTLIKASEARLAIQSGADEVWVSVDATLADATSYYTPDMVSFLIGCSFTFETALVDAGIEIAHIKQQRNVPMYRTNIPTTPAGVFSGPMVVSMRPIPASQVSDAVRITSCYPSVHGAPVHVGDPAAIGIADLAHPDFGDAVDIPEGCLPVFWACGVTPQAIVMESKPELAISHAPGKMLVTSARDAEYLIP